MRDDTASLTARGVALGRSRLDRPAWPTGDADAEARLYAMLAEGYVPRDRDRDRGNEASRGEDGFRAFLVTRTRFFDSAVIRALRSGVDQIVILAAGYDGRALRFHSPGVTFFEVDHPATQADKRARLDEVGAPLDGIVFVAADFIDTDWGDRLAAAGHDPTRRTLFTCEGLLRYLPEHAFRGLLATTAGRAAPGSEFVASVSTREGPPGEREQARIDALAESGEAVLTVPHAATALAWVAEGGWRVVSTGRNGPDDPHTRLLVRARPA
ncbi:MAG TPA: SAM-dependent methyltransferase [Acidimicrobiia bacterium]|jgi:methyltransferase (TIGR00027 family)